MASSHASGRVDAPSRNARSFAAAKLIWNVSQLPVGLIDPLASLAQRAVAPGVKLMKRQLLQMRASGEGLSCALMIHLLRPERQDGRQQLKTGLQLRNFRPVHNHLRLTGLTLRHLSSARSSLRRVDDATVDLPTG